MYGFTFIRTWVKIVMYGYTDSQFRTFLRISVKKSVHPYIRTYCEPWSYNCMQIFFDGLKIDLARLKLDFAGLKFDFARPKFDFARLKFDFAGLKFEFAGLKFDFARL